MKLFDAHCDTILRIADEDANFFDGNDAHQDYPRMVEAGVGCQVFACFVSREEHPDVEEKRVRFLLDTLHRIAADDRILLPSNAEELASLGGDSKKLGLLAAIEGGEALGGRVDAVKEVKNLGVRYVTIAWGDNNLTGSCFGSGAGLTELGVRVVREMERNRVLIDLSHTSDAGFDDVFANTEGPVIASHSNCRAICPSPRNLTDEQIERIASRGGAVGVNYVSGFLTREAAEVQVPIFQRCMAKSRENPGRLTEFMNEAHDEIATTPVPPMESVADHIDRIARIGGIDSVALGSDFDGFKHGPILDVRQVRDLLDILRARGYDDDQLQKICWDNWVRVFSWTFE